MKNDDPLLSQAIEKHKALLYTSKAPYKAKDADYVYVAYRKYKVSIVVQPAEGTKLLDRVFLGLVKTGANSFDEIAEKLKIDNAKPLSGRENFKQLMEKHFRQLEKEGFVSSVDPSSIDPVELTSEGKKFLAGAPKRETEKPRKTIFYWNHLTQKIENMSYKDDREKDKIRFEKRKPEGKSILKNDKDKKDHDEILTDAQDDFHKKSGKKDNAQWIDYNENYKHREQYRKVILIKFEKDKSDSDVKELLFNIDYDQKNISGTQIEIKEDQDLIEKYGKET